MDRNVRGATLVAAFAVGAQATTRAVHAKKPEEAAT